MRDHRQRRRAARRRHRPARFRARQRAVDSALIARPATGLHDNTRVRVGFVGFSAYQPVTLIECTAQVLSEQDTSYCDPDTQITTITPALGTIPNATFFAERVRRDRRRSRRLQGAGGVVHPARHQQRECLRRRNRHDRRRRSRRRVTAPEHAGGGEHPVEPQPADAAWPPRPAKIPGIASTPLSFGP